MCPLYDARSLHLSIHICGCQQGVISQDQVEKVSGMIDYFDSVLGRCKAEASELTSSQCWLVGI